eukprot:gene10163-2583_t
MKEENSSWFPKILLVGSLSIVSFGIFSYFNSAVPQEIKKKSKKKISQEEPEQIPEELWLEVHNLKECGNWNGIKQITENRKDLLSKSFYAEALKYLDLKEESFKILTSIIKMENPENPDDIFAIGRAHQSLGNYEQAFDCFKKAAKENQLQAIFSLGIYYQNGIGMKEKDLLKAQECFEKGSSENDAGSLYLLSITLEDNRRGFECLEKSADLLYLPAIMTLGEIYLKKDSAKAVEYFTKGANLGHPKAELNLGVCYANGDGVEKSDVDAYYWVEKSAEKNDEIALYILGGYLKMGLGCEKDVERAEECFEKSAKLEFPSAQFLVAKKLLSSDKDDNLDKGVELLEKAAAKGHEGAMKMIEEFVVYDDDENYVTDDGEEEI